MFVLGIISFIFIVLAIVFLGFRFFVNYRLDVIQRKADQSELFQKKTAYIRKVEDGKHVRALLLITLILALSTLGLTTVAFIQRSVIQTTKTEVSQLKEQLTLVEQQQEQLISNVPLKNYPEGGIGIKEYDWEKLFAGKEGSMLQSKIESDISQRLVQYFGLSNMVVSLDIPSKTLSINLMGQTDNSASKETIKENVEAFVKEAEDIPGLTQIHIQLVTTVGKTSKLVYSANYTRDKNKESFKKVNDSERNVKREGGKG